MKPTFPQIISLTALIGAVTLFAIGNMEAGIAVLGCAAFQLIDSPLKRPEKPE